MRKLLATTTLILATAAGTFASVKALKHVAIACAVSIVASQAVSATTVAYDGETLASDSQATAGDSKDLTFQKIYRVKNGIVGIAGKVTDALVFLKWCNADRKGKFPAGEFEALYIDETGCYLYEGNSATPIKMHAPTAIGSGADSARGAMLAGATAAKAIEIAEQIDLYTGGPVQTMHVDPSK